MSGFECFLGLTGPLGQLWAVFENLKGRYLAAKSNDQDIVTLEEAVKKCQVQTHLQREQLSAVSGDEAHCLLQRQMDECHFHEDNLQQAEDGVLRHKLAIRGPIRKLTRARRTREAIDAWNTKVGKVSDSVDQFQTQAGACLFALHMYNGDWSQGAESRHVNRGIGRAPVVILHSTELYLPPWVRVDFNLRTPSRQPATQAGKMRHALLTGVRGKCSNSHHYTIIQITGESGIGKSCAIRGLIRDHDQVLQNIYCDAESGGGIHYFSLGRNMTTGQIINMLADRVHESGGLNEAARIRNEKTLFVAVGIVYKWLEGRNCLFFFDEEDHAGRKDVMMSLIHLSQCSYSSAVVFSRQKHFEAGIGETIHLQADPWGLESRSSLLHASQLTEEHFGSAESSELLHDILGICQGFVLCLNNVGRAINLLHRLKHGSLPIDKIMLADSLRLYVEWYNRLIGEGDCEGLSSKKRPYFMMLTIQLRILGCLAVNERRPRHLIHPPLADRFISLCSLGWGEWVPYEVLYKYWELQSEKEAEEICFEIARGRLGYHEERQVDGTSLAGFRLHHRGLEYSRHQARARGELEKWRQLRDDIFPEEM